MKNRILLTMAAVLMSVASSRADNFSMLRYEVNDGLSHNTVRCVVQDKYGFMWFGTADGLNRFDGRNYKIFHGSEADTASLANNSVYSLYVDQDGDLWVGSRKGVYIYEHRKNTFSRFTAETRDNVSISTPVNTITDDGDRIWIGTQGQGVFIYDRKSGVLKQTSRYASMVTAINRAPDGNIYIGSEAGTISALNPHGEYIMTLYSDFSTGEYRNSEITAMYLQGDTVWFAMGTKGLRRLVPGAKGDMEVLSDNSQPQLNVTSIFPYGDKTLFIGTDNGLYTLDTEKMRYERVVDMTSPFGYYNQDINDIYRDSEGGIWIATQYGGVNYLPRKLKTFDLHLSINSPGSSGSMIVNSFCQDAAGNIWVGTWNEGLLYLNGKTNQPLSPGIRLPHIMNIQCLMLDGNDLWIGTFSKGVYVLDLNSGSLRNYRHQRDRSLSISDNSVNVIYKDSQGTIYIGTAWGVNRYNPSSDTFNTESRTNNQANISDILEDSHGYIWFSSSNIGLFRYGPQRNSWNIYQHNPNDPASPDSDHITCLFEDDKGRIWVGSDTGLCCFDYDNNEFTPFAPTNMAIPGQVVSGIEQDMNGDLWVSSNTGLLCLDVDNDLVINQFSRIDGLQSNQFNHRSSIKTADGKMYFGGINGFNSFCPNDFKDNRHSPRVLITDIRINDREVTPDMPSSPLGEAVYTVDEIKLSSNQNSISFDFSTMSYQSPVKNHYSYILEGRDTQWSTADNRNEAVYSNLSPGKYRFVVTGSNNDGLWSDSEASVGITIKSPFYKTAIAYLLYMAMIFAALSIWMRSMNKRHRRRMREYAVEQEKKSYRTKIEFFTNLAHEIRTPLTLIKIPLESIIASEDGNVRTRNYLDIMNKSAGNLLNLINQLLDFRKSEETQYELTLAPCDMGAMVSEICMRFKSMLQINDMDISVSVPAEPAVYNVDPDAMGKIISNLVSNASKYAAREIKVSLTDRGDSFVMTVEDDGPGIEPSQQRKIFEAFYQSGGSKAGTGIGLPLAKALTEKHKGKIIVKSDKGHGARFIISIPRLEAATPAVAEPAEALSTDMHYQTSVKIGDACAFTLSDENITVLVVEDHDELRGVIADIIGRHYSVLTAEHGKAALEVLDNKGVDIIVSDIMMPEMDGYQLTEFVKSDMRYSHIPVIQLTAKTSMKDRIKGLEYGSDAYIEKPFSPEHLLSQINNLLENRKRLRETYNASLYDNANIVATGSNDKDDKFIEKLNCEIEKNIQNESFYIDTLAESLCMSRSNFYRKIKSMFGVSPNEYLRRCRLKKAAEMLRNGEYRASDVYMLVGFNSLSYFSTCFKNHFGVSPTKYAEPTKE